MVSRKRPEQWIAINGGKVGSPDIFRAAAAVKENVARRLESTIGIVIPIPAVEYPRARSASVGIAVLVEIHELVQRSKIHGPAGSRETFFSLRLSLKLSVR